MGKSQVPKGTTKKIKCKKCGTLFYPSLIGGSMKLTEECVVCNPNTYNLRKK